MIRLGLPGAILLLAFAGAVAIARAADAVLGDPPQPAPEPAFVLGPPNTEGPVSVQVDFALEDINEINDSAETFEFTGVLRLEWRDPRQGFDAAAEGVQERVFQGAYQVNEIAPGWFPQMVLVNEAGMFETAGVVLRVRPDGTSTLLQTVNAVAETDLDLRLFPFDRQRLAAIFEVLGFDLNEVRLQIGPAAHTSTAPTVRISEWDVLRVELGEMERDTAFAGSQRASSALVLGIEVERQSWHVRRLIVLPLIVIVLLSFSVFWMHRSSLADRLGVSFVGILTVVAYQIVVTDQLPRISYFTIMHTFIGLSFITMCLTVVASLVVGRMDASGRAELGDRIDRRCRWMFPLAYFSLVLSMVLIEQMLARGVGIDR
jgi:hypothetical protein